MWWWCGGNGCSGGSGGNGGSGGSGGSGGRRRLAAQQGGGLLRARSNSLSLRSAPLSSAALTRPARHPPSRSTRKAPLFLLRSAPIVVPSRVAEMSRVLPWSTKRLLWQHLVAWPTSQGPITTASMYLVKALQALRWHRLLLAEICLAWIPAARCSGCCRAGERGFISFAVLGSLLLIPCPPGPTAMQLLAVLSRRRSAVRL